MRKNKNRKFDWREKTRDFVLEEWPGIATVIFFLFGIVNFILFY